MSKTGLVETERLRQNLIDQLDRVVKQLAELEEYNPDEYESMKEESKQQLVEFNSTLSKMSAGNMSLVDELSAMKMAVQAAISEAFRTPEIISMFAKKQPAQLRLKLEELERDRKIGHVQEQLYIDRKLEMLTALKKLNDPLTLGEQEFLNSHSTEALTNFAAASSELGSQERVLDLVGKNK